MTELYTQNTEENITAPTVELPEFIFTPDNEQEQISQLEQVTNFQSTDETAPLSPADHRDQLNELFGNSDTGWTKYEPSAINIAELHTDGKYYFPTDIEKKFPLEKNAGDIEMLPSDSETQWVSCYEQGEGNTLILFLYSRDVKKEADEPKDTKDETLLLELSPVPDAEEIFIKSETDQQELPQILIFDLNPLLLQAQAERVENITQQESVLVEQEQTQWQEIFAQETLPQKTFLETTTPVPYHTQEIIMPKQQAVIEPVAIHEQQQIENYQLPLVKNSEFTEGPEQQIAPVIVDRKEEHNAPASKEIVTASTVTRSVENNTYHYKQELSSVNEPNVKPVEMFNTLLSHQTEQTKISGQSKFAELTIQHEFQTTHSSPTVLKQEQTSTLQPQSHETAYSERAISAVTALLKKFTPSPAKISQFNEHILQSIKIPEYKPKVVKTLNTQTIQKQPSPALVRNIDNRSYTAEKIISDRPLTPRQSQPHPPTLTILQTLQSFKPEQPTTREVIARPHKAPTIEKKPIHPPISQPSLPKIEKALPAEPVFQKPIIRTTKNLTPAIQPSQLRQAPAPSRLTFSQPISPQLKPQPQAPTQFEYSSHTAPTPTAPLPSHFLLDKILTPNPSITSPSINSTKVITPQKQPSTIKHHNKQPAKQPDSSLKPSQNNIDTTIVSTPATHSKLAPQSPSRPIIDRPKTNEDPPYFPALAIKPLSLETLRHLPEKSPSQIPKKEEIPKPSVLKLQQKKVAIRPLTLPRTIATGVSQRKQLITSQFIKKSPAHKQSAMTAPHPQTKTYTSEHRTTNLPQTQTAATNDSASTIAGILDDLLINKLAA